MNPFQDILDLCTLNKLAEAAEKSPAPDAAASRDAIEFTMRRAAERIQPATLASGAMERHVEDNTSPDGIYPWTDDPMLVQREAANGNQA